jgi:streptogramin lyase
MAEFFSEIAQVAANKNQAAGTESAHYQQPKYEWFGEGASYSFPASFYPDLGDRSDYEWVNSVGTGSNTSYITKRDNLFWLPDAPNADNTGFDIVKPGLPDEKRLNIKVAGGVGHWLPAPVFRSFSYYLERSTNNFASNWYLRTPGLVLRNWRTNEEKIWTAGWQMSRNNNAGYDLPILTGENKARQVNNLGPDWIVYGAIFHFISDYTGNNQTPRSSFRDYRLGWYNPIGGSGSYKMIIPEKMSWDEFRAVKQKGEVTYYTLNQPYNVEGFGSTSGRYKWGVGVLDPNGKIYALPASHNYIAVIDPINRTKTELTDKYFSGGDQWLGGVLAPNGKIYGIPYNSDDVLEINPETNEINKFYVGSGHGGYPLWYGGVLASNGKIYGVPYKASRVLEFDPTNKTVATFGSLGTANGKWAGSVLAPNGKIYCLPYHESSILEINPSTRSVTKFGDVGSGQYKYAGGALAPNGKIYALPADSGKILEIDPNTRTVAQFGNFTGDDLYYGCILAPNGRIYGVPHYGEKILELNPRSGTNSPDDPPSWRFVEGPEEPWIGSGQYNVHGGILAPNGKMYFIPYDYSDFVEVDLGFPAATGPAGQETWSVPGLPGDVLDPRSAYFNKF